MNGRKTASALLVSMLAVAGFQGEAFAAGEPEIHADAAIVIDGNTGKILYGENEHEELGIASMTKMMTEYLVQEAVKDGKIKWDHSYKISDKVYQLANAPGLSNVPLKQGESYTVKELYEAMVIKSGNGAAIALSEIVAGSEGEFVKKMNAKAKDLGMKHYHFVNSSGLSNVDMLGMYPEGTEPDDENVVSAEDMAILAYRLIHDYPETLETSGLSSKKFRPGTDEELTMKSTNGLLKGKSFYYKGADGLKTGTTPFAGTTFTATAERNGNRYISVILDAKDANGQSSSAERFIQSAELLDYGFNEFEEVDLSLKDATAAPGNIKVYNGKERELSVSIKEPIALTLPKVQKEKTEVELVLDPDKVTDDGKLIAPIEKGEKVGVLKVKNPPEEEYIPDGEPASYSVDVTAEETVEKASWVVRSARGIKSFFKDLF